MLYYIIIFRCLQIDAFRTKKPTNTLGRKKRIKNVFLNQENNTILYIYIYIKKKKPLLSPQAACTKTGTSPRDRLGWPF